MGEGLPLQFNPTQGPLSRVGWVERSETHQSRPHHRADRGIAPLTTTTDGLRLRLNPSYATLPDSPHGKIRPSEAMARVRFPRPSGRAEERRSMGGQGHCKMPLLRNLTRCGCLNVENAVNEVSSAAPPIDRAPQVARSEAQGHGKWGPPFFGFFFWRSKKRNCAAGRTSRHTT